MRISGVILPPPLARGGSDAKQTTSAEQVFEGNLRSSEGRRPESESKSLICEPAGAKPSITPAVVSRPLPSPLRESPQGRSLRVHPPSFCAPFPPYASPRGEAFEYAHRRFAPPFLRLCCVRRAKPSSTPATVFRPLPPFLRVCCVRGRENAFD